MTLARSHPARRRWRWLALSLLLLPFALLAGTVEDRLTWGFDVLINGIVQTPLPRDAD